MSSTPGVPPTYGELLDVIADLREALEAEIRENESLRRRLSAARTWIAEEAGERPYTTEQGPKGW